MIIETRKLHIDKSHLVILFNRFCHVILQLGIAVPKSFTVVYNKKFPIFLALAQQNVLWTNVVINIVLKVKVLQNRNQLNTDHHRCFQ